MLRINYDEELRHLLLADCYFEGSASYNDLHKFLRDTSDADLIGRAQRFAFRYYLPDAYLSKVDRMSMANALEVRVPFLDHRLVEFSLSIPGNMHWENGTGKQLLRRAVADLLPAAVFTHRKQGFSIPLHRWTTETYFELAEELLSDRSLRRRGLFRFEPVRRLLDRCRGRTLHRSLHAVHGIEDRADQHEDDELKTKTHERYRFLCTDRMQGWKNTTKGGRRHISR